MLNLMHLVLVDRPLDILYIFLTQVPYSTTTSQIVVR